MLPPPLAERVRAARLVVEVGAGRRFDTALAMAALGPRVLVTDIDTGVLSAPAPLQVLVDDVTRPDIGRYGGAELVVAVRAPEELQLPIARLARRLGADLAMRPLKDEWADITPAFRRSVAWPDGWRYFTHA